MKRTKAKPDKPAKQLKSQEMERRVFNDAELTPRATLVGLRAARAGPFFVGTPDDELALHHFYEKSVNAWAGTKLGRILEGQKKGFKPLAARAASGWTQIEFLQHVHSTLCRIVREAFNLSNDEVLRWLKCSKSEREEILKESKAQPKRPKGASLSRIARDYERIAKACERAASRAKSPALADYFRARAADYREAIPWICKVSRTLRDPAGKGKPRAYASDRRRTIHAKNMAVIELLEDVRGVTGNWHYREIAALLTIAGLPYTPNKLRALKSRDAPYLTEAL